MTEGNLYEVIRDFSRSLEIELSIPGIKATFNLPVPERQRPNAYDAIRARVFNTSRPLDVFVVTAHNLDEVVRVDHVALDYECSAKGKPGLCPGGSGANTAFLLGAAQFRVKVAGIVGDDDAGRSLLASFDSVGVDASDVIVRPGALTGRTEIKVADGAQRFTVVYPKVNNQYARHENPRRLAAQAETAKILHLSSFAGPAEFRLQVELAERVRDQTVISLTPGSLYCSRGADRIADLLRNASVLFLYQEQLLKLVEQCSPSPPRDPTDTKALFDSYFAWKVSRNIERPQLLIVKERVLGASAVLRRSFISVGAGYDRLDYIEGGDPLHRSLQVVDTTGAGDAAAAGALRALLQCENANQCADDAFAFAGFVSTQLGARTAYEIAHAQRPPGRPGVPE